MEEKHESFIAVVRECEMLAAIKVKMSRSESKNDNNYTWSFENRVSKNINSFY